MKCVTAENYVDMCRRVKRLDLDDEIVGNSNIGKYLDMFQRDDCGWIQDINIFFDITI